ncbi:MAG: ABC transporter ATP-binding protein [Deltaproteobacteria bacterium]|jgi:putative ABC transport system ATP-binding protein|nr:ABC transporter ATP-binding protein [Deltaproteobacteria bacterium]
MVEPVSRLTKLADNSFEGSKDQSTTSSEIDRPAAVKIDSLEFCFKRSDFYLKIEQFKIESGETVFVSGPSGCGKSTLLSLIAGILKPFKGEIVIDGQSLSPLSSGARDRLRGDKIGFIFQQFNLTPYLSVLDNALLSCRFSALRRKAARLAYGSERAAAEAILTRLGLDKGLFHRQASKLSVGQRQRVAAARALMGRPPLLIADEPTSALDADNRHSFLETLVRECSQAGAGLLFVSHDKSLAGLFHRTLTFESLNLWRPKS